MTISTSSPVTAISSKARSRNATASPGTRSAKTSTTGSARRNGELDPMIGCQNGLLREPLFRSPVELTPYQSEERIDDGKLRAIIEAAYAAASLKPDDIDTGVVILTGEALRRENAQAIAAMLAEQGGELVCATAGHHM